MFLQLFPNRVFCFHLFFMGLKFFFVSFSAFLQFLLFNLVVERSDSNYKKLQPCEKVKYKNCSSYKFRQLFSNSLFFPPYFLFLLAKLGKTAELSTVMLMPCGIPTSDNYPRNSISSIRLQALFFF